MDKDIREGTGISWQVFGTGPRPALAIHCMLGTSDMWGPLLSPLAELSTIAFDLPGHGKSDPWVAEGAAPGAYQTLATRIAASFIERPLDLIGHSFGASVALRIAVAAPEAVRSLTLIEPVLFAAAKDSPEWAELRPHQDHLDALLADGADEEAARRFVRDWGAGAPWDTIPDRHRARFIAQMPIVANVTPANFEDPGQICRPGGIEAIDAPVMLIHGDQSPPISARVCEALAARMADVGTACVPGAGHMLPLTHTRQVTELIALNLERS